MIQGQPHSQGAHSSARDLKNNEENGLRQNEVLNALGGPQSFRRLELFVEKVPLEIGLKKKSLALPKTHPYL